MTSRYDSSSVDNFIELALSEIESTYGTKVRTNRKTILKFGRNNNVGTAITAINYNNIVPFQPDTNSITTINSTSASDVGKAVTLDTMVTDGNGDFIFTFQTVTLNGTTAVTLPSACSRVSRIKRAEGSDIVGDVYAHTGGATTGGVPNDLGTVGNVLSAVEQTTLYAGTSVASTNYLVLTNYSAYLVSGNNQGSEANIRLEIRGKNSNVYRTIELATAQSDNGKAGSYLIPYQIIPPNHDVRVTAEGATTGLDIVATFQGFFADIY